MIYLNEKGMFGIVINNKPSLLSCDEMKDDF